MEKIRVLISNDDGINAPGLVTLAIEVCRHSHKYDVRICGPAEEQSAQSHAVTCYAPLWAERYEMTESEIKHLFAIKVWGSPADCVKLAISSDVMENWRPQIVLSGINRGLNLGSNTIYSGTVAAAMEANVYGIPSIAYSYHYGGDAGALPFSAIQAVKLLDIVTSDPNKMKILEKFTLNVNFPSIPEEEIKGWKVCHLGNSLWKDWYQQIDLSEEEKEKHPSRKKFRIRGKMDVENEPDGSDTRFLFDGYITLTPLGLSFETVKAVEMRNTLAEWKMPL